MNSGNAVSISDLSASYEKSHLVLDKINGDFPAGKFSVLLGKNGSGKSTLFKILAGLENHSEGRILFFDAERKSYRKEALLGFLPQNFHSIFPFSVRDILLTGRSSFMKFEVSERDHKIVEDVAGRLDISDFLERSFNTLSGGQQQLVFIGRILVQDPRIILLDEPTNHLDIPHQHQLLKLLRSFLPNGYTIIAVMHDPILAHQYADHIFVLNDKKILKPMPASQPDLKILNKVFNMKFKMIKAEGKDFMVVESDGL